MNSYADRIKPDSYGITTYLEKLRRGEYQIPTFQREVEWDRNRVKKLWDSIYNFYPLGSILVWITETRLHNDREIGGHLLRNLPVGTQFQYLLDGQQRTTALLTSIYGGSIKGQEDREPRLYADLTVPDSDQTEEGNWRERFLYWDEIDDRGGQLLRNTGRKKNYDNGLVVKLEDIGHRYSELEERLESAGHLFRDPVRTHLRRLKQVLDNYKLSFIELRGIEVAEVCQIFERINQAGQPLSMFDIVVAKTFRPQEDGVSGFYLRGMFQEFRRELDSAGSQYAMLDDITILRVLAVIVRENVPDSGVQNITDRYLNALRTQHIEEVWDEAKVSLKLVFDFLDNHLNLPGPVLVPYIYFYMSLAAYFFRNVRPDREFLKQYFWYFAFHNDDLLSNTTQLFEHIRRLNEVKAGREFGFGRFLLDRDKLRTTTYSSKGRLSRAILALFANHDPKDWEERDRSVLKAVYYTLTDQPNLHHIFPLDFCKKNLGPSGREADSLLNIAYLTQITNLHITNRNPVDYLQTYICPGFEAVRKGHFLPDNLLKWAEATELPEGALHSFIEARLDLLLDRIRQLLADIPFEVIDTGAKEAP